ncbi:hypothetical protein ACFO0N_07100 [Halobium salinum]|uniref:Glycosyltransferase RgtA/B/C/D-like domain-containing protein n=1 Tax=Halobium salinum TaxID=1364940 RepID=A0ABD5PAI9_9EURY|nr:hypothetical protein [Halobium salinum]
MALYAFAVSLLSLLFVLTKVADRTYRVLAPVAFAVHTLVAVVVLPLLPYRWDTATFDREARAILNGGLPSFSSTVDSFAAFHALVYAFLGADPIVLSLVNGLLAVLTPLPLYRVLKSLYPSLSVPRLYTLAVLFLPLPLLFTTLPMRDALSILVFVTALALLCMVPDNRDWRPLVVASPLLALLSLLRPELAAVLALGASAGASLWVLDAVSEKPVSLRLVAASATTFGFVGFLALTRLVPLSALNRRIAFRASGGAAYLEGLQYESWFDVLLLAPIRGLYFQFAPFPLHVNSAFDLLALGSLPLLVFFFTGALRSLYRTESDRVIGTGLIVVYVGGVIGYGLIDSNFGTSVRHRIPFVLLLITFAAPTLFGLEQSLEDWLRVRPEERREGDEQDGEREELDSVVHVGEQYPNHSD